MPENEFKKFLVEWYPVMSEISGGTRETADNLNNKQWTEWSICETYPTFYVTSGTFIYYEIHVQENTVIEALLTKTWMSTEWNAYIFPNCPCDIKHTFSNEFSIVLRTPLCLLNLFWCSHYYHRPLRYHWDEFSVYERRIYTNQEY